MKQNFLFLLTSLFTLVTPQSFLVKIDLPSQEQIFDLGKKGIRVLEEMEGYALVLMNQEDFASIKNFSYQVLDNNPETHLYYFVRLSPNLPIRPIESLGKILFVEGQTLLLKTEESNLIELNRLPVELKRVFLEPMVISSVGFHPPQLPLTLDTLIQQIANKVSPDSILSTVRRLQRFRTRYSTTDSCRRAADYILQRFQAYNMDSVYFHYFRPNYAPNQVAIKRGSVYPNKSYIICGHMDATSSQAPEVAPGADDNASGTAAVLEAARILKDYEFEYTIQFIGFSGEEQGLYGSDSFARQAYRRGDSILGVLNFDMIGYGTGTTEIYGKISNPNCEWLVDYYIATCDTYTTLNTIKRMVSSAPWSDHHSFWQRGYVAFHGFEYANNPYYHLPGDTIGAGFNDLTQCTENTRGAVATLAKLARVMGGSGTKEVNKQELERTEISNYPNPFNAFTVIRVPLSADRIPYSAIRIYDVTGRLVKSFSTVNGQRQTEIGIVWDGTDDQGRQLTSGIYFYRLEGPIKSDFKKAVRLNIN